MLKKDWLRRSLGTFDIYSLVHHDSQSTYYLMMGFIALYAARESFWVALYAVALMTAIALVYGEMGSHFPETGGSYLYTRYGMGVFMGFLSAWLLAIDQVIMVSYGTLDASKYTISLLERYGILDPSFEKYSVLIAILFSTALYVLTVIGIRESAFVAKIAAVIDFISIGLLVVSINLVFLLLSNPPSPPYFNWSNISPPSLLLALALASRGFTGIDALGQLAGEAKKPLIQIPRATILLVIIGVYFSLSLMLLTMTLIPYELVSEDPALVIFYISDKTPYISSIAVAAASINIILIMLLAALTGYVSFSRLLYIFSQDRLLPSFFGRVHRIFRTPHISLTTIFIISLPFIIQGEISFIVEVYAIGSLMNYLLVSLSLAILSRRGELYGGFQTPRIRGIPITVILGTPAMITGLIFTFIEKYSVLWIIGLWVLGGVALYTYQRRTSRKTQNKTAA